MKSELHILHLEDNGHDAELIHRLLHDEEIACELQRVETRHDFAAALERGGFDLILSDYSLPGFDGSAALALARERLPNVPFLFVSGTLGEEVATESLKRGATDYVLKERLARLAPAVRRALAEAEKRAALQRAEEAMIQSEFKYRQLFECLSEAALVADGETGRVLDSNRQAEILLGRTRAEIIGLNQNQFHPLATFQEFRRRFADPGNSPARVTFEGEVLPKDGPAIPVAVSAAPILLYGHRLILGLYRDITERKRAEAEIEELKNELQHHLRARTSDLDLATRELDTYSNFLTRGLRERVRAIADSAHQILAQHILEFDATATDPVLFGIRQRVQEIEQLIDRLLAFAELKQKRMKRSTLDMTALARAAFEELKLRVPLRQVRFELETLPPAVGDPVEIRRVLTKLLANALKFTRTRRVAEIRISAQAEETQTSYNVRDNGLGFAPTEAATLFGVFQQLHSDKELAGIGLGLALVQRIIQRHGGQVGADGQRDVGAVFSFSLPKHVGERLRFS